MAIAAGINLICTPLTTIALSRSRMMAPDGRCKAFDASADGFVRSEGCGVIVLKRLSAALADRDRILALVRGTAANQDGRSSGITAPNGPSQESVIRSALASAGVTPGEIDFVETHGTGTSLGDPIEVHALGAVFGADRPANRPLAIGSVKTNIGHLESAAGVAGLIKTILALRNETIPPSLHFRRPNPHIRWEGMPVVVPVTLTPWVRGERPRLAGVSSFGFSGTNVHVVLGEAPAAEGGSRGPDRPLHVFTLSAKSEGALLELASRHAKALESSTASLADVCYTATTGRAHLPHRIACVSESAEELRGQLESFVGGEVPPRASAGRVRASARTDVAFLCSVQGAQYPGMARRLYETERAFRTALDRCADALVGKIERPLLEVIFPPEGAETPLHDPAYAQPANFAVEYAAAEMWKSWGIVPSAVVGHSLGEFVAACLAGMIGVEDGVRLVATRGRLMQGLPPTGAMAAIHANEARVADVIDRCGKGASIAALNHPEQTVVSGPRAPVEKVFAAFAAEGVKTEWLRATHGYHSPEMEPIAGPLVRAAREAAFAPPRIAFVSTMTGALLGGNDTLDPEYWGRQVVAPVRYVPAVGELRRLGYGVFLDVGPAPVLAGMGRYCFPEGLWLATLRPGQDEWSQALESLAALHAAGVGIDWEAFHRPYTRRRVALPTYPFERQRYWATAGTDARTGIPPGGRAHGPVRPLLGVRLGHPLPTFESRFDIEREPVLGDHRIGGSAVVPGPVYIEMALAAASELFGPGPHEIADLRIREAMLIEDGRERVVQTVVTEEGAGRGAFRVCSLGTEGNPTDWRTHVEGRIRPASEEPPVEGALGDARSRCDATVDVEALRKTLLDRGIEIAAMGAFEEAWRGRGEVLARLRLPGEEGEGQSRYRFDPAVLDAAMLAFAVALSEADGRPADEGYFLVGVERVRIFSPPGRNLWSHASLLPSEADRPGRHLGDLRLFDDGGGVVASLEGLRFQRAEPGSLVRGSGRLNADWFYREEWEPIPGDPVLAGSDRPARPPAEMALECLPGKAKALQAAFRLEEYAEMGKELDLACAAYAEKAIRRLGWDLSLGAFRTADGIAALLGVVPRHRRLFGKLLDVLVEEGFLARRGEEWAGTGKPPGPDPDGIVDVLRERHPRLKAQLELTAKCGRRLDTVLRGEVDPLHLLFEGGSFDATEALYRDSPSAQAFNALVREAVSELVGKSLPGGKIRVLEIGAGTGGTSSAVLPVLPPGRTEYSFTDISNAFLVRAREKFADFPFLRFQLLDIERDPQAQGFVPGAFDLVIAANVLHATADMRKTLRHVRSLLAPGGSLLLLEGTRTERWVDLTFGLTEGWWKYTDLDLRPSGPALSTEAWRRVLGETGFTSAIVPDDGGGAPAGQPLAVIVAGVPTKEAGGRDLPAGGGKSRRWIVFADRGGTGEEVAGVLRRRGDSCVLVEPGAAYRRSGDRFEVDARSPGDIARMLGEAGDGTPLRMLYLWGLDAGECAGATGSGHDAETACSMAVSAIRGLLRSGASGKFWIVTRGAQKAGPGIRPPDCGQAPLWGIGRGIAVEHPDLWGGLVDLDPETGTGEDAATAIECACREDGEDQVAVREGKRLAARLVRVPAPAHAVPAVRGDGSYLVTGGLGGLGLKVARWLFDRGARHLVLTGRRGLPGREAWPTIDPGTGQGRSVAAVRAIEQPGPSSRSARRMRATGPRWKGSSRGSGWGGRSCSASCTPPWR
jgi:acyl transferase domain-containing protein